MNTRTRSEFAQSVAIRAQAKAESMGSITRSGGGLNPAHESLIHLTFVVQVLTEELHDALTRIEELERK